MFSHAPVMINESLDSLMLNKSGAYLDCTFGLGGHSKEILKRLDSRGSLSAIDQDQAVLKYANKIQDPRFKFQYSKFSKIGELFINKKFDGIFFDLGVSSLQLDDASRGFSFQRNGKLDMRMDQTNKISALDWINKEKEQEIADIFYYLGVHQIVPAEHWRPPPALRFISTSGRSLDGPAVASAKRIDGFVAFVPGAAAAADCCATAAAAAL